jgi:curved DNA-binding protein CbpA
MGATRGGASQAFPDTDYYGLLGVPVGASQTAIRVAYRQLAKRLHPDASGVAETSAPFRRLVEAYEVLSDPVRRRAYDARRFAARPVPPPGSVPVSGPGIVPAPRSPGGPAVTGGPGVGFVSAPPRTSTSGGIQGQRGGVREGPASWESPWEQPARSVMPPRRAEGVPSRVTPIEPVSAIGAASAGSRLWRAAASRMAAAQRVPCVDCGTLLPAGSAERCPACANKYGSFQEYLDRATGQNR